MLWLRQLARADPSVPFLSSFHSSGCKPNRLGEAARTCLVSPPISP